MPEQHILQRRCEENVTGELHQGVSRWRMHGRPDEPSRDLLNPRRGDGVKDQRTILPVLLAQSARRGASLFSF